MMPFLLYLLKASLALAVFYLFYRVALRDGTLLRLNRAVLLGSVAASFVLPCAVITFHRGRTLAEVTQVTDLMMANQPLLTDVLSLSAPVVKPALWLNLVALVYLVGVVWVLGRLLRSICHVRRILRSGEPVSQEDGIRVYVVDHDIIAFSWMRNIVISRADWQSGRREILDHESAHVRLRHSRDLLLVDFAAALQWFNPFIWMLREDLCAVHEFQADAAVLERGADRKGYLFLLVQKAAAHRGYTIANSFSDSVLKDRVRMMSRPAAKTVQAWRLLACAPLLGLVLLANARVQIDGFSLGQQPILLLDNESVSWNDFSTRREQIGDFSVLGPEEIARAFGRPVPMGLISMKSRPEESDESGRVHFQLIPGFNVSDPDQFPLMLVNGVEFPYQRRMELGSGRWNWKWYAYIHGEEAMTIFGEKARNGVVLLNVIRSKH